VAPQLRDVDRHAVEEGVELLRIAAEHGEVVPERPGPAALGERPHAALHLAALVLEEVDVAQAPDARAERLELVDGDRLAPGGT
jgi:hypothetical protein